MGIYPEKIYLSRGQLAGHCIVQKFGYNPSVGTTIEPIITLSTTAASFGGYLTTATTVRIKAGGNAADDAAGAGAREVTIIGLDENWEEQSEAVATAGASASAATTTTFIRVYRAFVSKCGTYGGANTAAITIEDSGGSDDLIQIGADVGQTEFGLYTIPAGKTGYLTRIRWTIDASKTVDCYLKKREQADDASGDVQAFRTIQRWIAQTGVFEWGGDDFGIKLEEKTDVICQAVIATGNAPISVSFDIVLVDN